MEPDVTWHTVKNLLEGRGYIFRVFAENAEGLSEPAVIDKAAVPQRPLGKNNWFFFYLSSIIMKMLHNYVFGRNFMF